MNNTTTACKLPRHYGDACIHGMANKILAGSVVSPHTFVVHHLRAMAANPRS